MVRMGRLIGAAWWGPLAAGATLACGGGSSGASGGPGGGIVGSELQKPSGSGSFFLDEHRSGTRNHMGLAEIVWGRLVDVHGLDASGEVDPVPAFREMLVRESLLSDGFRYLVETNPATLRTRLVVLRRRGAPDAGSGTFEDLLAEARDNLPPVLTKGAGAGTAGPFSLLPRNGAISLRFDDLLEDSAEVARDLDQLVRVVTGYPPSTPFSARVFFDPNHGGVARGAFHSTRVLVDTTVTESEAASHPRPLDVNVLGLPPSQVGSTEANVALRLPTVPDPNGGQFEVLRSIGGAALDAGAGPFDSTVPTADVVRAFRSGNQSDLNQGNLLDFAPPELVGNWRAEVLAAQDAGAGRWKVDVAFPTQCGASPEPGDILEIGTRFVEVTASGSIAADVFVDVEVRPVAGPDIDEAKDLVGVAFLQRVWSDSVQVPSACWVTVIPETDVPGANLSSFSTIQLRFSEPMDTSSVRALDTFRLVRGGLDATVTAQSLVVGSVSSSEDQRIFSFTPTLPLDNRVAGAAYRIDLVVGPLGIRDLAGNSLPLALPPIPLALDPDQPRQSNGSIALRFSSIDEIEPFGFPDLRGNVQMDTTRGIVFGRPVTSASAPCDTATGTLTTMYAFPPGVQTPLSALGSKLHAVWRYADFGWSIYDESKYDLDVTGMSWTPAASTVLADYFPRFSIRLTHSRHLPDEACVANNVPFHDTSGLSGRELPFEDHVLRDPRGGFTEVHPEHLGYRVDPNDLFVNAHGFVMLPFPLNRGGGERRTFTWRDTSVVALGGQGGVGVPMDIEVGAPLFLENAIGAFATTGKVPTVGLPLLWQINCFPSAAGLGLNPLTIVYPCTGWPTPNFRAFSTGGVNTSGVQVFVDPSIEAFPAGGFDPTSNPPGKPTPLAADNSFYVGQLDYVVRVSRMHTVWMDSVSLSSEYAPPVIIPAADLQPPGTAVIVEFRGADGFLDAGMRPFDALRLSAYGEFTPGLVDFFRDDPTWTADLPSLSGARYLQVRVSFVGNIDTGETPELDSIGIAYRAE